MASSSGNRKYPPRLYEIGKTPIQNRNMNHSCFLSNIQTVEENVGADVWSELRESAVGVIIKLKELDYTWSAKCVHYFLVNQLAVASSYEIWSLLVDQPMRFSLYEFGDITGLNCDPFDTHEQWDVGHEDFWVEMKVPISKGPKLNELQALFPIIRNWPREKRLMVGLLCLLSIGIFGISSNSRIPLHCAKRVMDATAFQRYPWGRVGFTSLVDSIKVLTYVGKKSYTLRGCVHALAIWIYESVPGLGEIYGQQIDGAEVPLLSWHGSRQRINFLNFCAQEKQQHQKVLRIFIQFPKVLDFIKSDLEKDESGFADRSAEFYVKLIIPREAWPTKRYGWLHDSHMAAEMLMFHRRSMQSKSPYSSPRIAFLDRWFVQSWVNDYKKSDQTTYELADRYSMAFNGEYPEQFVTGKKWLADVDTLFLCHHVNGDHWVALRIDLVKEVIHVYDSIPSMVTDKKMHEECRPFTKMLPALLNKMVDGRTKRDKQFTNRRHKKIPKNEDPGDCGVYTLKYIECLALGYNFEGLSNQIMPALRLKMGVEIYEEVAMEDKEV
ncbi:BnaC01g35700D [Brassica napus]|uniref:(rape) hypothetical protein n=1 Tax=Brassica napus TaxID=3708 RepID=A0A078GAY6_BRANA|nr:unnamed protein product [Brassica napus]CDY21878.1 BnaC01g35700D [Brassica napus]